MNQIQAFIQIDNLNTGSSMCNCENDACTVVKIDKIDLPILNRTLIVPDVFTYYNHMPVIPVSSGYEMCYEGLPNLNQMATSLKTEESNSVAKSSDKSRRGSCTFEYEFFGINSKSQEQKKHSDIRLKTQEKKLNENELCYESIESYNSITKRTSRVLVCMHLDCGREFKKTRNLIIHSRVHTKIRPYI